MQDGTRMTMNSRQRGRGAPLSARSKQWSPGSQGQLGALSVVDPRAAISSLRARRIASAFSRALFSDGFSQWRRSFAKNAFALHLLLEHLEGLIDIVVADENCTCCSRLSRRCRTRRQQGRIPTHPGCHLRENRLAAAWLHGAAGTQKQQEDQTKCGENLRSARVPRSRDLLVDKSRLRHQRDFVSTGASRTRMTSRCDLVCDYLEARKRARAE